MLDLKKLRASRKGRNKISINLETNADVLEGEGREGVTGVRGLLRTVQSEQ